MLDADNTALQPGAMTLAPEWFWAKLLTSLSLCLLLLQGIPILKQGCVWKVTGPLFPDLPYPDSGGLIGHFKRSG